MRQIEEDLKSFFESVHGDGPGLIEVDSLYIKELERHGVSQRNIPRLLVGEPTIPETIHGISFRISPEAFFQVNTLATEVSKAFAGFSRLLGLPFVKFRTISCRCFMRLSPTWRNWTMRRPYSTSAVGLEALGSVV